MAELLNIFKKPDGERSDNFDDEVSRELLKYGKSLEEWKQLEALDEEYKKAKNYMQETQSKLDVIEKEMKRIEQDNEAKENKAHQCHLQAKALYDQKEYRAAIDKWNEALSYVANHQGALYGISEAKSRIKELEEKKQRDLKEREQKVQNAEEHFLQGKKYFLEEKYEAALLEWKESVVLGGRDPRYVEAIESVEAKIKEQMEEGHRRKMEENEKKEKIQELLVEGRKYLRDRDFDQGIKTLDRILLIDAQNKFVIEEIRKAENMRKEWEKTTSEQEQLRIEALKKIREYQVQAMNFERAGTYEAAIEMLSKVLEIDPTQEKMLDEIKRLQETIKREEEKRQQQERETQERLKLLAEEEAKQKKEREQKLQMYYTKGVKFFTLGNYERAIEEFEQVMLIDQSYETVQDYFREGEKRLKELREEQERKAREEARLAEVRAEEKKREEEKRESEVQEIFRRGLKLYDNGEYEQAIAEWENALIIRRNEEGIKAEIEKARKKMEEKKSEEYRKHQQFLRDQEEAERRNSLMRLYSDQAEVYFREEEYEKAAEEWRKVLELDFKANEARENVLRAERAIKEIERKKLEAEKKIKEKKREVQELCFRAEELFNEELYENAVERWEKVLEIDSVNRTAQEGIIKSKAKLKEILMRKKAKELAEQLMRQEEDKIKHMRESYEEGERLYREGDFASAIKEWEKAMGRLR